MFNYNQKQKNEKQPRKVYENSYFEFLNNPSAYAKDVSDYFHSIPEKY